MSRSKEKSQKIKKEKPMTFFRLLFKTIKGMLLSIPQIFKKLLIKMVIIFAVILILNTYLVVVRNEGFSPTKGNMWLPITSLKNDFRTAMTFWLFATFFITSVIGRIRKYKIKAFVVEVFGSPIRIVKDMKISSSKAIGVFLLVMSIMTIIAIQIKNPFMIILYFFMMYLSYTLREKGLLVNYFSLAQKDLDRLFRRRNIERKTESLYLMVLALAFGFLIVWLVPDQFYLQYILSAILFVLALLLIFNKIGSRTVVTVLGLSFIGFAFYRITTINVLADDGGWKESGGTLAGWLGSQGALTAVAMGLPPGGAASAGLLIGALLEAAGVPEILEAAGVSVEEAYDSLSEMGEELYDDIAEESSQLYNDPGEFVSDITSEIKDTTSQTYGGIKEEVNQAINDPNQFATDIGEEAFEQAEMLYNTTIGSAVESGSDIGEAVYDGVNNLTDGGLDSVVEDVKDIAGQAYDGIREEVDQAINDPNQFATDIGDNIYDGANYIAGGELDSTVNVVEDMASQAADEIKEEASQLYNDPAGFVSDITSEIKDTASQTYGGIKEEVNQAINDPNQFATDIGEEAFEQAEMLYNTTIGSAVESGSDIGEAVYDGVNNLTDGGLDSVVEDVKEGVEEFSNEAKDLLDKLKEQND